MRLSAQARNPYSRSWLWIPGSLATLPPRNDDSTEVWLPFHPRLKLRDLACRQAQSQLGSPPHDVISGARPFRRHQIPHLGFRQTRTERPAEIGKRLRIPKNFSRACAVGVGETGGVGRFQKRKAAHQLGG